MPHDHSHSHDHTHSHSHGIGGHHHAPTNFGRTFAIATALNVALVAAQFGFGLWANSLALIADAGHNLSDVMGLILAWVAFAVARWRPSSGYTYQLGAASILAALANGLLLVAAVAVIGYEAIERFAAPQPVASGTVMLLAALGVVVNGASAWMLSHGSKSDLNMHGAFLHMVADAAVSVAVIAAGFGIWLTGWQWLDPAVSLLISAVILVGTWRLLRDSLRLALNAAPREIDPTVVRGYLQGLPEVQGVHDLHIWAMSTTENALTAHLVTPAGHPGDAFLHRLAHELEHRFGIGHCTVQVETADKGTCETACDANARR
ncbi:cation diffusion facilitator family transporter [Undibacter mobilis]|uniref:Cation transporter n=1 Tax=Undibacter mobilis TaxID=2292256 RepID=A0A371B772_9BRAD|nr:cation diffusion facilitator family transporter [Undibacter mobilis]RDV03449.1 cation transporter [Undibacter mobilis]